MAALYRKYRPQDFDQVVGQEAVVRTLKNAIAAGQGLGRGVEEAFKALVAAVGPRKAVAVMWLVARTISHALISNTLHLASPVPSIFEKA